MEITGLITIPIPPPQTAPLLQSKLDYFQCGACNSRVPVVIKGKILTCVSCGTEYLLTIAGKGKASFERQSSNIYLQTAKKAFNN